MSIVDPRALRDAFGAFITGVTVVTAFDADGVPVGFTANSFTSVSLDPPLLLVCIARRSTSLVAFKSASSFAVNILSESQRSVSQTFAKPVDDCFAAVSWRRGPHGAPVLDDVCAWFDCSLHQTTDAGDHVILIGRVEGFGHSGANGLGYARGGYFTPAVQERAVAAAASNKPVVLGAIVERAGGVLLVADAGGALGIPSTRMAAERGPGSDLDRLLASLGLGASPGFIYSVYADKVSKAQHIVHRCAAGEGTPRQGAFHHLDALPYARIADPATEAILRRFADESRLGNFGVYFGDERSGEVRRPASEDSRDDSKGGD